MEYKRIIVPLDGSLMAEYVVPHVEAFARALDAEVVLLHVLSGRQERPSTVAQKRARSDIGRYLEKIQDHLLKDGVRTRWQVCFSAVAASAIARVVKEEQGDLLIMATHGKGESKEAVGSVAAQTLELVSVPILLLRPPLRIRSL